MVGQKPTDTGPKGFLKSYAYVIVGTSLYWMEVMDATNMKPRNDKYSAKVYNYYVEYSDKSSHKKTHTETETHATKAEVRKAFSLHDRGMWRLDGHEFDIFNSMHVWL